MMKNLFASALLPLAIFPGLDFSGRLIDPSIDDPGRLAPGHQLEINLPVIAQVPRMQLPEIPWSDRAWDHNRALMNERYTDSSFTKLKSWPERRSYGERHGLSWILSLPEGLQKERAIASLSPAEKYDLLMGISGSGLTEANRASLDEDIASNGGRKFPTWWGICEGSAAASLVSPEPVAAVTVHSEAYGIDIPFYAPDVKALLSLLWSSYNKRLRLPEIGRQCDGKGGGACFDVNPASFHIALHHFLGRGNGHLVVDIDETPAVWNHPIQGFEISYFKPDESRLGYFRDFHPALLPYHGRVNDPRRRFRSPATAYLVGVSAKLYYGENQKSHPLEGSVKRRVVTVQLTYELELDSRMNIIGGEWISRKRPDILWTIPLGLKPQTIGDSILESQRWDGRSAPRSWEGAARASAREMMPLGKVVEELVRRSSQR